MDAEFIHKEYPKRFERDDFWRQIKRTVNGSPVSENEIAMIVDQIESKLQLHSRDGLLDLGCGNGALASRLFNKVASYHGVDFSTYLLEVANEFFGSQTKVDFLNADICDVSAYARFPGTTKILLYGCVSYLRKDAVGKLLVDLKQRIQNLQAVFIGNIPKKEKASEFFAKRNIQTYDTNDPTTPIGVWWTIQEWHQLAEQRGYHCAAFQMPKEFYGSEYRFDVLLEPTL